MTQSLSRETFSFTPGNISLVYHCLIDQRIRASGTLIRSPDGVFQSPICDVEV